MKKLLLILLSISLFSCNNNYEEAEELYEKGVNKKSKSFLRQATLKLDMIKDHHNDYTNANVLKTKIDSVKKIWDLNAQISLKRKNDSIAEIRAEELAVKAKKLAIKVEVLKNIEAKKYPNLVGRWELESSTYSSLNSIVRIYKENGVYYRSMKFEKDNSESIMKLSKQSKTRFNVVGKSDYLLISTEGQLTFWDKQGYFLSCLKINLEDID